MIPTVTDFKRQRNTEAKQVILMPKEPGLDSIPALTSQTLITATPSERLRQVKTFVSADLMLCSGSIVSALQNGDLRHSKAFLVDTETSYNYESLGTGGDSISDKLRKRSRPFAAVSIGVIS